MCKNFLINKIEKNNSIIVEPIFLIAENNPYEMLTMKQIVVSVQNREVMI